MPITEMKSTQSIFDNLTPRMFLVNPVNCVGVMGSGLALEFKQRWPEMFKDYAEYCSYHHLKPGRIYVWSRQDTPTIINLATKDHYRGNSKIEWVHDGLRELESLTWDKDSLEVRIPAIGCGLGGLEWEEVRAYIRVIFRDVRSSIRVYGPKSNKTCRPARITS